MTFGEKLQNLRKIKHMSQEELASKITVSRQAVSKWELNESVPDTENVIQISKVLGVSIDYLLDDEINTIEDIPIVKETSKRLTRELKNKYYLIGMVIIVISIVIVMLISDRLNIMGTVSILMINFMIVGIIGAIVRILVKK
jgi:Predicted transcriptional regulators